MVTETQKLPDGWQWIKLTEIAERGNKYAIVDGPFGASIKQSDYLDCGVPLIRIQNISKDGTFINKGFLYISEEKYREQIRSAVKKDDILVSRVGTIGNVCIYPGIFEKALLSTTGVCKISINKRIADINFVYFFMLSEDYKNQLISNASESVQKYITLDTLKDSELPFPPLAEQKRIAAIAQKADRLRRTRRYALQLSDTYLQSVFLEMFGDPASNPKGWNIEVFSKKLEFITTGSRGWAQYYSNHGNIFLRVQNLGKNELLLNDVAYVQNPNTVEAKRTCVKSGDLLISMTADLGRTAVIPPNFPEAYVNQHVGIVRLKEINPVFISALLASDAGKKQFDALDREGVKSGLNFDDIRSLKIIVPPLPLQEKFAQIVQKFERLRTQQREAERQAEHLFQTLLHCAFRGELTPQHANDEPASVLLEQIGAEQAKAEAEAKAATQAMGNAAEYLSTKAK
ncbi:restriction endonuclease subunit S [Microcoleus sp. FACHB-SPT15]|uniref:restriction endonuclease subunit S n=1 Tax=Microcoleus sp. FACHB-SPT15 TaxID=2692830 RepID=UPI0017818768|nr:restriction endonuclease subunit S [Microcoleus sp. FACHB-SPT15]MBD1809767.1 restriction endonuclease subunit S [Microcoleus sp. FACHB-SPT15]